MRRDPFLAVWGIGKGIRYETAGRRVRDKPGLYWDQMLVLRSIWSENSFCAYADECDYKAAGEKYFPDEVDDVEFYRPTNRGLEKKIIEKLNHLKFLDEEYKKKK